MPPEPPEEPSLFAALVSSVRSVLGVRETFLATKVRYDVARKFLLNVAERGVNHRRASMGLYGDVRLTIVDETALRVWRDTWPRLPPGEPGSDWDWAVLAARFRKHPDRVEVAVWHHSMLCGLAFGRISTGREVVRIDILQGRPGPHPLKRWIALVAAETAGIFAQAFGAKRVRFHRPLPGARLWYESIGFTFVEGTKHHPAYCERQLP